MSRRWRSTSRVACTLFVALLLGLTSAPRAVAEDLLGFTRGDCNGDGETDISDNVTLLVHLFNPVDPLGCEDACDMNDDGAIDLADPIYGLTHQFIGGPPYPAPYPGCGTDGTEDSLTCATGTCVLGELLAVRSFTLESARAGMPYRAKLPTFFQEGIHWQIGGGPPSHIQEEIPLLEYGLPLDASLVGGLSLDPGTGVITGISQAEGFHAMELWGKTWDGDYVLFRADLALFSADDAEIIPGQPLEAPGPHPVTPWTTSFFYTHEFPWPTPYPLFACIPVVPPWATLQQTKAVRVYYPSDAGERMPVLFFHHGTGFNYSEYGDILSHYASHGVICISVNDPFSYESYPNWYCWGGHDEGARVLVACRRFIEEQDADPASALFERVDWDRVFYGGHSRGGASAIIARELDPDTRGVIALQPTDAKGDSWIGYTNRWEILPDVPILNISAEQDFDVIYPWAERLLERFTGHASMVTIYGGCHGYTTDGSLNGCSFCNWLPTPPFLDQCRYVPRAVQHDLTKLFGTAFLLRHGFGDLSVEGILYGGEIEGSVLAGVASRRNLGHAIVVDDFTNHPTNSLGGETQWSGSGNVMLGSCYDLPASPPAPITPIANLILQLTMNGTMEVHTELGTVAEPLDVTGMRMLACRLKNHDRYGLLDNFGFSWLNASVALEDADGDLATVSLGGHLPGVANHPTPEPPSATILMKYQRYISVTIDLGDFVQANPDLDLDRLLMLRWEWITSNNSSLNLSPRIGLDDVMFE